MLSFCATPAVLGFEAAHKCLTLKKSLMSKFSDFMKFHFVAKDIFLPTACRTSWSIRYRCLVRRNLIVRHWYCNAPWSGSPQGWNGRGAVIPVKKLNFWRRGRATTGISRPKWKLNDRPIRHAKIHFGEMRCCGEILPWIFSHFPIFTKLSRLIGV